MTRGEFASRVRGISSEVLPLPASGATAERHRRLFEIAHEDVSLAKIAEAHWDALAILAEAGHLPYPGALYAVWASEAPGKRIVIDNGTLNGRKPFASGFGLVDRALITVDGDGGRLIDLDLRQVGVSADLSRWRTAAFALTATGELILHEAFFSESDVVGTPGFYTARPGFWHGACGPAACWAGGAAGLLTFTQKSTRRDPHTLAHIAAMQANIWAMQAGLDIAGAEIDREPHDMRAAQQRALTLRHVVEQLATDTLRRFARAFGPYPLAMDDDISRRYQEVDLFLRQCHGERDLEVLGRIVTENFNHPLA